MNESLRDVYARAIRHHEEHQGEPWLVPDSIPIVYFGNLAAYLESDLKIITVGLNPSDAEFSEKRFDRPDHGVLEPVSLEHALSEYFRFNPYQRWFQSFEKLLQPLGASYYDGDVRPKGSARQKNIALHTDIASPLATAPTWSQLSNSVRDRLRGPGYALWLGLVRSLRPDLILISVAQQHLLQLGDLPWRAFDALDVPSTNHEMRIAPFEGAHVVWGRAQVTPFFHFKTSQCSTVARSILGQPELLAQRKDRSRRR